MLHIPIPKSVVPAEKPKGADKTNSRVFKRQYTVISKYRQSITIVDLCRAYLVNGEVYIHTYLKLPQYTNDPTQQLPAYSVDQWWKRSEWGAK